MISESFDPRTAKIWYGARERRLLHLDRCQRGAQGGPPEATWSTRFHPCNLAGEFSRTPVRQDGAYLERDHHLFQWRVVA
jgi:hypothetical protein